jgi:crotonobetainyl-CoA:carnitine CoA-transferase CaiB-like acyl-CoA transferase
MTTEVAHDTALDGTLVIELGSRIGVSVCGSLLAQLGATVVFVEGFAPGAPTSKWSCREQFAAGKQSLLVDRASTADKKLLAELLDRADVVLVSPDVDQIDVPHSAHAVVCEITAYGSSGPDAGRPDDELAIQARTGIIDTTGNAGGNPVPIELPVVEYQTGAYAAGAVLAALRVARQSGQGQRVEAALYDCAFAAMATFLPGLLAGTSNAVNRIGNRHAMISPWNVFQAKDGWVLICAGSDQQWLRLTRIMGREEMSSDPNYARIADRVRRSGEVDAAVQVWAAEHTVDECLAALSEAQIACGPVVEIGAHPAEPNLIERGMITAVPDRASGRMMFVPGSPIQMSASPGRAPQSIPAPDEGRAYIEQMLTTARPQPERSGVALARPLSGVKIVEIGHYTTVPLSTKHLGALGAEVIKIEPPEGEATREWLPVQGRQGYFFTYMNSDKKSLVLDLRTDEGAAALWRLIEDADVLIENLKPGALAKRGFTFEKMSERNPRLIYAGVSGFGVRSLYPGRPAFDTVIQAMSGIMDVVRADGVPLKTGISTADLMGAIMAVVSVLGALAFRDRTGRGQSIDLSMQDIAAWMTQIAWNDGAPSQQHPSVVTCSDGYVLTEREVPADAIPANATRAVAVEALRARGIAASAILTTPEMLRLPQTEARQLWFTAPGDEHNWPLLECPMRLSLTPAHVVHPMPALGRDNAAVLGDAPAAQRRTLASS